MLKRILSPSGIVAAALLCIIAIAALAPQLFTPYDPLEIDPLAAFSHPSLAHPCGTDESGRDVCSRLLHATGASLGIGFLATALGAGCGTVLGCLAALGPRLVNRILARTFEVLFALPTLVMALLFVAVLGSGIVTASLAIALATIPGYAKLTQTQISSVKNSDYVSWARLDGASRRFVFMRHIAPNSYWPLISALTLGVGQAIVWVAALGFLGLGAQPPAPEWGAMLNAGRIYLSSAWWLTVLPGAAIVLSAAALTVLGKQFAKRGAQ